MQNIDNQQIKPTYKNEKKIFQGHTALIPSKKPHTPGTPYAIIYI